jgi:hypothetical protein
MLDTQILRAATLEADDNNRMQLVLVTQFSKYKIKGNRIQYKNNY